MCGPLGNKVTLIYPNERAPYNFVNVNFDVADGFNIHVDVETKNRQKEMSNNICYLPISDDFHLS